MLRLLEIMLMMPEPVRTKPLFVHKIMRLCDMGNTVVVIEHNLDVIKMADYIIDLGPEGGDAGGTVVAAGKPEDIVKHGKSYTGKFLKAKLEGERTKK